jgi:hypothetical protein
MTLAPFARKTVVGALSGGAFGAAFGALAHLFAGGPGLVEGVTESAPFFAVCGAIAAAVMATEQVSTRQRSPAAGRR